MSPKIFSSSAAGHVIGCARRDDRAGQCAQIADLFGGEGRGCSCGSLSVEQIGEALLDAVSNVERQRLDGRGRVDAAGGHPDAAVDDEKILHVMATAPFIHHRTLGIGAHARGAEQMPAAVQDRALDANITGAGAVRTSFARAMPCCIIRWLLALMV